MTTCIITIRIQLFNLSSVKYIYTLKKEINDFNLYNEYHKSYDNFISEENNYLFIIKL